MANHRLVGDNRPDHDPTPGGPAMIFGREPALLLGLVSALVQFASAVALDLSDVQQGAVNTVAGLVVAVVLAWKVSAEKVAAALVGLTQALVAAVLAFGVQLPAETQSSIMVLVVAAASFFVRTQVTAPVPAQHAR